MPRAGVMEEGMVAMGAKGEKVTRTKALETVEVATRETIRTTPMAMTMLRRPRPRLQRALKVARPPLSLVPPAQPQLATVGSDATPFRPPSTTACKPRPCATQPRVSAPVDVASKLRPRPRLPLRRHLKRATSTPPPPMTSSPRINLWELNFRHGSHIPILESSPGRCRIRPRRAKVARQQL